MHRSTYITVQRNEVSHDFILQCMVIFNIYLSLDKVFIFILIKILTKRLQVKIEEIEGLGDDQFGFRKGLGLGMQ